MKSLTKLWSIVIGVWLKKVSYLYDEILSSMAKMQKIQQNLKELEVFTAFYFKAVASFLFQTVESVITIVTK